MADWLTLNIIGTEWVIVVFVALVLILGTGKLPAAAKKMGRAVAEFEKAKNDIRRQAGAAPDHTVRVSGPVSTEREKLEAMAKSVGMDPGTMSDEDLRRAVRERIGGSGGES